MKLIPYNQIRFGQDKIYRKVSVDSSQYLVSLDTVDSVLSHAFENDCFPKTFEAYVVLQKIPSWGVKADKISDKGLLSKIAGELECMASGKETKSHRLAIMSAELL